ncbi:MAG: hypothetical protein IBJ18_13775 [Phycisphaerales bacterium]|nr:hypothetical protein [Phycisphaerales bacterium]
MSAETPPVSKPLAKALPQARARARFERWYPWGIGLLAAILVAWWNPPAKMVYDALKGCLGSAVDAAAILAGFQGTALALLFTLIGSAPVKALRRRGLFSELVRYHWHAILAMLIAVGGAMGLLALQGIVTDFGAWSRWIAGGSAFVVVAASLAAYRVTRLMVMILMLPNLEAPENSHAT